MLTVGPVAENCFLFRADERFQLQSQAQQTADKKNPDDPRVIGV